MKTKTRARLSVDLEAYPDVREMLNAAELATGKSPTHLTVLALRKLPVIVEEMLAEQKRAMEGFTKKFPSK